MKKSKTSQRIILLTVVAISFIVAIVFFELSTVRKFEYYSDTINEKVEFESKLGQIQKQFIKLRLEMERSESRLLEKSLFEPLYLDLLEMINDLLFFEISVEQQISLKKLQNNIENYFQESTYLSQHSKEEQASFENKQQNERIMAEINIFNEELQGLIHENSIETERLILDQEKYYRSMIQNMMITLFLPILLLLLLSSYFLYHNKKFEQKLFQLAYFDVLSKVYNHHYFKELATKRLKRLNDEKGFYSLLLIDAHTVTRIDNTLGPVVGDEVLVQISDRIKKIFSDSYLFGRLGGCVFMMLTPEFRKKEEVSKVADQIIDLFNVPFQVKEHQLDVNVNLGISIACNSEISVEKLEKQAGNALIASLDQGENKYVYFDEEIEDEILEKIDIENGLKKAGANDEFKLYYQPIVDVSSKATIGFEALIRWERQGQVVPPISFIPLAEANGMIISIGEWVLRTACTQIKEWEERGMTDLTLSVNISPIQLEQTNFTSILEKTIGEMKINPNSLTLEITENMIIENLTSFAKLIDEIREFGVQIALDDFGTGYSSLSYLKKISFDILKIDKSFIDTINEASESTIIDEIISIAHKCGLKVIAEGVETEDQFLKLEEKKVDRIQGYFTGKPRSTPLL